MKEKTISKSKIVKDWLPRYTGAKLNEFGEYILLTNFYKYLEIFSQIYNSEIRGLDKPMPHTTANGITIINFNMGSPNAATIIDLLTAINPKACLFLGKCGGLKKKNKIGDFILPLAAIRGDGTSNDYLPKEVPALQPSNYRERYLQQFGNIIVIIGQEQYIQQIEEFGNMMRTLKNI